MKRTLVFAITALLAAGCSNPTAPKAQAPHVVCKSQPAGYGNFFVDCEIVP